MQALINLMHFRACAHHCQEHALMDAGSQQRLCIRAVAACSAMKGRRKIAHEVQTPPPVLPTTALEDMLGLAFTAPRCSHQMSKFDGLMFDKLAVVGDRP